MSNTATTTYSGRFVKPGKFFMENAADIDFLKAHETAEQLGRLHRPQLHSNVLELFRNEAEARGLALSNEKGILSLDGRNLIYTARVNESSNPDFAYTIGFRNYNDRCIAFHGMFGSEVFVCTNGMCTGYIKPSRMKHMTDDLEDYKDKINVIYDYFPVAKAEIDNGIEQLKSVKIDDQKLGAFLVDGMRCGTFCSKVTSMVLREFDKPTLNADTKNAWHLANAVTYVTTHEMKGDLSHRERITKWSWDHLRQLA